MTIKDKFIIEMATDVKTTYPFLEIFCKGSKMPYLEIGISEEKLLYFRFYLQSKCASQDTVVEININEMAELLEIAKRFHKQSLENEDEIQRSIK